MAGFEMLAIATVVPAVLTYWAYSRWQARSVLRKLSGKGKKGQKKAWRRLSDEERLVVEQHHLRMLKLFAIAFSVGSCGALVQGKISVEADLIVLHWFGDVTMSTHPVGFWILWLSLSVIPVGLWVFYFHERRALVRRTTKAAARGDADPSESA
jgi:nicotinamide riboside transporter PnuC